MTTLIPTIALCVFCYILGQLHAADRIRDQQHRERNKRIQQGRPHSTLSINDYGIIVRDIAKPSKHNGNP